MSINKKIAELEEKERKLQEQKKELIQKQKIRIGDMASKVGVLDYDDNLIIGAFAYIKELRTQNNSKQIDEVKKKATPFLVKRKGK